MKLGKAVLYISITCSRYPFDTQKCPIKVLRNDDFSLKWSDPPTIQKMIVLTQYDVNHYLEYDNTTSSKNTAEVMITLCRKLSYHIFNTYIPTLVLIMIIVKEYQVRSRASKLEGNYIL